MSLQFEALRDLRSYAVKEFQATLVNERTKGVEKKSSREHYVRRNTPFGPTPFTINRCRQEDYEIILFNITVWGLTT